MTRKPIPDEVQKAVLTKSRRRCCLCFWLNGIDEVQKGQIAHLDQNNENADEDNLVFLCFDHHDAYDGTTSTSKGLREDEVRHWRDELYRNRELSPPSTESDAPDVVKKSAVVEVHNTSGNVFVGDGHSINIASPPQRKEPALTPIVNLRLALSTHVVHGFVHFLVIEFLNRSDRHVFIGNFFLDLNDDTMLICPRDGRTGEPQQKRKVESGDKFSFFISEFDLRAAGRPATDYLCAGVVNAVGGIYRTDMESVQNHIADLLKDRD